MLATVAAQPKPEAIEVLLEAVSDLLEDERERGKNLDTKASALAGFVGVILALTANFGREVFKAPLGCVGDVMFPIFFFITVLALSGAALLAVVGVLRPQRHLALKTDQIKRFALMPLLGEEKDVVQGRLLTTLARSSPDGGPGVLERERAVNDRKAKLSKATAWALGVGYIGVVGQAITLGVHEIGV